MHYKYKKEKGAVTIFCVIVLFTMVLLGGVFIDGTRILLAKQMVRASMNSAARSALSYYDEGLTGDFGLYGVTEENAKKAFKHYFEKNLTLSQNDGFNLYKFEMGDEPVSVSVSEPLSDNKVFQEQINEFQKYRVGVNLTIGTIDKLKGLFGNGKAGDKVNSAVLSSDDALKKLKKSAKEFVNTFNATISSAINTQAVNAKKKVLDAIESAADLKSIDLGKSALEGVLSEPKELIDGRKKNNQDYEAADKKANEDLDKSESSMSGMTVWDEDSGQYVTSDPKKTIEGHPVGDENSPLKQAERITDAAEGQLNTLQNNINTSLANVRAYLDLIQQKRSQINALENEISSIEASSGKPADLDELESKYKAAESDYNDYLKNSVDYETYISELNDRIAACNSELTQLREKYGDSDEKTEASKNELKDLQEKLNIVVAAGDPGAALKKRYDDAKAAYDKVNQPYLQKLSQVNSKKQEKKQLENDIDALKKDIEAQYDSIGKIERIDGAIDYAIKASDQDEEEAGNVFTQMKETLDGYLNKITEPAKKASLPGVAPGSVGYSENSLKLPQGTGLIGDVKNLVEGIVQICQDPSKIMDKIYYVDYTMDKFTFLTSGSSRPSHWFQMGEVEYIYSGNDIQGYNNLTVLGKIAMIRLAIDFTDDLVTTHSPEVVSRLCIALGRALIDMAMDMKNLVVDGQCRLSPSFEKVKLKYSDHLRLMLLIDVMSDSNMNEKYDRTKVMINDTLNQKSSNGEKVQLSQLYTRVSATSDVRINLIMLTLPMFEHVMVGNDTIKNGTFRISEKVSMGY